MRSLPELLLWDYKGPGDCDDAGEALPGIISSAPNVKRLTLKCPVYDSKPKRLLTSINGLGKLRELRLVVSHGTYPSGNVLKGLHPTFSRLTRLRIAPQQSVPQRRQTSRGGRRSHEVPHGPRHRARLRPRGQEQPRVGLCVCPRASRACRVTAVSFAGGGLGPLCSLPALSSLSMLKCCFQRPHPMRLGSLTALRRLDFLQQHQLPLRQGHVGPPSAHGVSSTCTCTGASGTDVNFDEYVTELATTLTDLVSLGLCCLNETASDAAVAAIATNLTRLTSLDLVGDLLAPPRISGGGLQRLGSLTKLKHIGIGRLAHGNYRPRDLTALLAPLVGNLRSLSLITMNVEEETRSAYP